MTTGGDDTREQGIEFGSLTADLESEPFPLTKAELLGRDGDATIAFADGSATLRDILQPENERTLEDTESVRQAIFAMVGDGAIGRGEYSDRGGSTPDGPAPDEQESL